MPRYDKYEPKGGGFRAALAADQVALNGAVGTATGPLGVDLDVNGRIVAGAGVSGIVGVLVTTKAFKAGDILDVMTDGEITDCASGTVAGTSYTANTTTGVITSAAVSASQIRIGHTVEATRLVVRART